MKQVYLDNNATTPIDEEVFKAMEPFIKDNWGNPSSIHFAGRGPREAIDNAREQVAKFLNCDTSEVVFTSSGSEGDNMAIKGIAFSKAAKKKGNHIITTRVEHPAVLATIKYLEKEGFDVTYLNVDKDGLLSIKELEDAITDKTILISVMYANNDTGVIFPIKEIGAIARKNKIVFHTDAVQASGKLPLDVKDLNVDLLTISAHKVYGPKGVGALYVRKGVRVTPLIHGGHHERNRRAGTENTSGIVGFGRAVEIAASKMEPENKRLSALRDKIEEALMELPYVSRNGHKDKRLPNTSNLSFEYIEGEGLLLSMDMVGIAASSGSACTSGSLESSHVLLAMGVPVEISHGSLRFSLGRFTTEEDVDYLIEQMPAIVNRIRSMSPIWDSKKNEPIMMDFSESACSH